MTALTRAEVASYHYHGFLFPFPALTEEERATCLAGLERYERWLGMPVPQADLRWQTHAADGRVRYGDPPPGLRSQCRELPRAGEAA